MDKVRLSDRMRTDVAVLMLTEMKWIKCSAENTSLQAINYLAVSIPIEAY